MDNGNLKIRRNCQEREGERVRLARGLWRPAKHIFARCPPHLAKLCASICQRPIVENSGDCGARRAAPRPGRSRSLITPMQRTVKFSLPTVAVAAKEGQTQSK